ncbi:MAG: hypothetical protein K6F52_00860 [Clostridia bacterium]|nr:hypothetical protein [Clostridia bacterium]
MKQNAKKTTVAAILAAMSVICIVFAGLTPFMKLSLYALASFFPAIMIIEFRGKGAVGLYAATSILGLILSMNKLGILPYIMFFGLYGILKYYIEKIENAFLQLILKGIFFAGVFAAAFFLLNEFFFAEISLPDVGTPLLFGGAIIFFYFYDALFSAVVYFYLNQIHPHIK